MPVVKSKCFVAFCCVPLALFMLGCRGGSDDCPNASITAEQSTIPEGLSETELFVEVHIPRPTAGLVPVTELSAVSGSIADPFARATTYECAHDFSGPVEVCVETTYVEADEAEGALSDVPNVGAVHEYLRRPHVRLEDPLECSNLSCMIVTCPEDKNDCPVVSSLTVDPAAPTEVPEGETATITVVAADPDDNPGPLITTLTARHGEIADPHASVTTYTCDSKHPGAIPICVEASDGACTAEAVCTHVRCPGEPAENTCPFIETVSADPNPIPQGTDASALAVVAVDPDEFPELLSVKWTSEAGGFEDPNAFETTFRCVEPGSVDVCVEVNDGDPNCVGVPEAERCLKIQCPADVVRNLCPNLNVITVNPSTIQPGSNWTTVQTRGWDTDRKPFPLALTLSALWGSFDDTENMSCPEITLDCPHSSNVVFQNAIYICDRPGPVELCVDGTDGACVKTLCANVTCPDDVPNPP